MDHDFQNSLTHYDKYVRDTRMSLYAPQTYDQLIDFIQFFKIFFDGHVEFTVSKNGIRHTFRAEYDEYDVKLHNKTPNELLNLYGVLREARARLTGTVFESIKEWVVVCLYQWSDVPFDEFAGNCSDFDPYYKLGGNGQNLHVFM